MITQRALFAAAEAPPRDVAEFLSARGFDLLLAHDGDTAVRLAMALEPELLLLRYGLPRKSGCQVCRIVRHDPATMRARVVLFAVGARAADTRWVSRHAPDLLLPGACTTEALRGALARWYVPPSEPRAGEGVSGAPLWEEPR